MKKRILPLLLALLLLAGCNLLADPNTDTAAPAERSIWAMDTQMDLRIYGNPQLENGTLLDSLCAALGDLDRELSATDGDSALSALNRAGSTDNEHLVSLAARAKEISQLTGGALDITLYPVSLAWGFTQETHQIPSPETLEALKDKVGMDRITLEGNKLSLAPNTQLDLGALAKGYAADLLRERMEDSHTPGILSLGGNIQTVGTKPDGSDWVIGVQDPDDAGRYSLTLRIQGAKSVVTSGDYQRYFMEDGVRYCHILDPKTLAPVRGSLRAVTVVADSGLRADALSTALFVLGREAGEALWRSQRDFEAIWMEADGSIWITPGLEALSSGDPFTVIQP